MGGHHSYSATPSSNTAINGIAVSDSTVPNTLDNIVRQQMADVRTFAEDIGGKNVSSGTDTITLTTSSGVTAYYDGLSLAFIAGGTNTGAATLNVDSVGAKAVRKGADAALAAGDITAGMLCIVAYDASANSAAGAWLLVAINPANFLTAAAAAAAYQPLDADLTELATAFAAASSSGAAALAFAEDTDNGSNKVTVTAPASLSADYTFTLPAASGTPALLDVADQTITGGARVTSLALNSGSAVTSGTLTLDPGDRPLQHYTNGGAHTLAPGSNVGAIVLDITNNGSAGAITTSGWTKVAGDSFTTTNGHKFRCHCSVGDGGSLLVVQALQ